MKRAIEIVDGFIERVEAELSRNREYFSKTDANNIYDAEYRNMLLDIHDKYIRKLALLGEVKRALENAQYDGEDRA